MQLKQELFRLIKAEKLKLEETKDYTIALHLGELYYHLAKCEDDEEKKEKYFIISEYQYGFKADGFLFNLYSENPLYLLYDEASQIPTSTRYGLTDDSNLKLALEKYKEITQKSPWPQLKAMCHIALLEWKIQKFNMKKKSFGNKDEIELIAKWVLQSDLKKLAEAGHAESISMIQDIIEESDWHSFEIKKMNPEELELERLKNKVYLIVREKKSFQERRKEEEEGEEEKQFEYERKFLLTKFERTLKKFQDELAKLKLGLNKKDDEKSKKTEEKMLKLRGKISEKSKLNPNIVAQLIRNDKQPSSKSDGEEFFLLDSLWKDEASYLTLDRYLIRMYAYSKQNDRSLKASSRLCTLDEKETMILPTAKNFLALELLWECFLPEERPKINFKDYFESLFREKKMANKEKEKHFLLVLKKFQPLSLKDFIKLLPLCEDMFDEHDFYLKQLLSTTLDKRDFGVSDWPDKYPNVKKILEELIQKYNKNQLSCDELSLLCNKENFCNFLLTHQNKVAMDDLENKKTSQNPVKQENTKEKKVEESSKFIVNAPPVTQFFKGRNKLKKEASVKKEDKLDSSRLQCSYHQ